MIGKETIIIGAVAFLAGHVVQSKFNTIKKIGDTVGMIPFIGDKLEDVIEMLE